MNEELQARRLQTLKAFACAWSKRNVSALLDLMTDDCTYVASIGPEPGKTYRGSEEVHMGILNMFSYDSAERSEVCNVFIAGDRAAWEWRYYCKNTQGHDLMLHGCDLFHFENENIARKEAFRKVISE